MPPVEQVSVQRAGGIAKTRQEPAQFRPTVAPPRGVLHAAEDRGSAFFHQRLAPSAELAVFVQHFWFVQWDLRGAAPSSAETLPHPSCYLVFEHDLQRPKDDPEVERRAEVSGVTTGKFSRAMEGYGRVFGLKFQPGGLRPFLGSSVAVLTDRVVPAAEVFGADVLKLARELRGLRSAEEMSAAAEAYFAGRLPARDADAELATRLVEMVLKDQTILSVEALCGRCGVGVRSLQRLFREYAGVSPKWVIRRYRLHELLERLNAGGTLDGAQVALELGYADQAHLINDFRRLAGVTPTEYLRRANRLRGQANSGGN